MKRVWAGVASGAAVSNALAPERFCFPEGEGLVIHVFVGEGRGSICTVSGGGCSCRAEPTWVCQRPPGSIFAYTPHFPSLVPPAVRKSYQEQPRKVEHNRHDKLRLSESLQLVLLVLQVLLVLIVLLVLLVLLALLVVPVVRYQ